MCICIGICTYVNVHVYVNVVYVCIDQPRRARRVHETHALNTHATLYTDT